MSAIHVASGAGLDRLLINLLSNGHADEVGAEDAGGYTPVSLSFAVRSLKLITATAPRRGTELLFGVRKISPGTRWFEFGQPG